MAKADVDSIVLEDTEHDVKADGVRAVNFETYRAIAVAGGFFDPLQDVGNHNSPLDLKGLRFLRDDPKADAARRQAAGDRLTEINSILNPASPAKVEGK